jgi:hypothetical protein
MSDHRPEDLCPWCFSRPHQSPQQCRKAKKRDWWCGSFLHGEKPWQSADCKLTEAEHTIETLKEANAKLRQALETTLVVLWWDDAHGIWSRCCRDCRQSAATVEEVQHLKDCVLG